MKIFFSVISIGGHADHVTCCQVVVFQSFIEIFFCLILPVWAPLCCSVWEWEARLCPWGHVHTHTHCIMQNKSTETSKLWTQFWGKLHFRDAETTAWCGFVVGGDKNLSLFTAEGSKQILALSLPVRSIKSSDVYLLITSSEVEKKMQIINVWATCLFFCLINYAV